MNVECRTRNNERRNSNRPCFRRGKIVPVKNGNTKQIQMRISTVDELLTNVTKIQNSKRDCFASLAMTPSATSCHCEERTTVSDEAIS